MERRKPPDLWRRLRFRTNQGSCSSSSLLFHILQVPHCPAPDADAAVMRCEDRATGDTPASPSLSHPHSLGEGWRGRRQREPSLPRRQENVLWSSFTESTEQRWRPATLEVALHSMGLDLFLHLHPSPPSCPRRGLLASTLCLHRGDPRPRP